LTGEKDDQGLRIVDGNGTARHWAALFRHRLREISGRFSAPVFPGETIRLSFWRDGNAARMEPRVPAHDTCVFADGRVVVEPDG